MALAVLFAKRLRGRRGEDDADTSTVDGSIEEHMMMEPDGLYTRMNLGLKSRKSQKRHVYCYVIVGVVVGVALG